jgi:aldehyde:ferredoxin oxidoreductase
MGITAKDDTLPKRFFGEIGDPRPTTAPLKEEEWTAAKQFYYRAMGWTEDGVPTRQKLQELGIGWVADEIGV